MKKTVLTVVFFAMLLSLFTASTNLAVDGSKGSTAPVFKFENSVTVMSIDKMKGEWVLLQFWASTDAQSRIDVNRYASIESSLNTGQDKSQFRFIGVNLDNSEVLFKEISRRDGLSRNTQFYAEGNRANRIKSAYHLDRDGFSAFLIDPNGKIVAKNPTKEQLMKISNSEF